MTSDSAVAGGTGQGSRFIKAFVRQLGGTLAWAAGGERGVTFTVCLLASVLA